MNKSKMTWINAMCEEVTAVTGKVLKPGTLYDHLPPYIKKWVQRTGCCKWCLNFERKMMLIRNRLRKENFETMGYDPTKAFDKVPTVAELRALTKTDYKKKSDADTGLCGKSNFKNDLLLGLLLRF